jgi:hypothetical protein
VTKHRIIRGLTVLTALSLIAGEARAESPPLHRTEQVPSIQPSLPEVTVRGQREALKRRVQAFVSSSIREPFEQSLARWNRPICYLVVGLSRDTDDLVRTRLSEIAAAAGAPLAPQPCEVNFVVIVTADPSAVMKAWYKRDFHLFGDATENRINKWLENPRAVRVWYNIQSESASEAPYATAAAGLGLGVPPPGVSIPFDNFAEASHTVFNSVRAFSSVIVAIDSGRAGGIDLKPLADYAAMVGLAEIQVDADLGEAPTILRLFSTAEGANPTGLTDWDSAFLKAIYDTSQKAKLQRAAIAQSMVHHLAP